MKSETNCEIDVKIIQNPSFYWSIVWLPTPDDAVAW